jgi:hypothetical protein
MRQERHKFIEGARGLWWDPDTQPAGIGFYLNRKIEEGTAGLLTLGHSSKRSIAASGVRVLAMGTRIEEVCHDPVRSNHKVGPTVPSGMVLAESMGGDS